MRVNHCFGAVYSDRGGGHLLHCRGDRDYQSEVHGLRL
jgi:hypothetical protein